VETDERTTLGFEGSLQIQDVERARERLLGALAGDGAIVVDVGALLTVDTAGLQLLVAFRRDATRRGRTVEYTGLSAGLLQTLDLLGLRDAACGTADDAG
jgi:anti-anti-sigma regulatory factor